MAHRAATDEICVTGGMGNAPSSKRRGLVRVSACCLLAPKDLACQRRLYSKKTGRGSRIMAAALFVIDDLLNRPTESYSIVFFHFLILALKVPKGATVLT